MARIDAQLEHRIAAQIDRHGYPDEAARTVLHVAVRATLRSVGAAAAVDLFRDAADLIEHEMLREGAE